MIFFVREKTAENEGKNKQERKKTGRAFHTCIFVILISKKYNRNKISVNITNLLLNNLVVKSRLNSISYLKTY